MATAPEPTGQGGADVLSAAQVQRWKDEGAILVSGLFPSFPAAKAQAEAVYPAPGDVPVEEDAELPYGGDMQAAFKAKDMKAVQTIMGAQPLPEISRFPHNAQRLVEINLLSVEPRLLSAAAQLLHGGQEGGEYELRLAQSSLMPELEGSELADSRTTSSLVAPVEAEPDAIEVILYYADSEHAPGTALIMKADHPHVASAVPAGTRRLTQHIIMRKASSEWVSSDAPIRSLSGHGKMLGDLLPAQRTALVSLIERPSPSPWACAISFAAGQLLTRMGFFAQGFPKPGHPYWRHPSALALAIGRYPAFDPGPYIHCENGAPVDFMEQFEAGVGAPSPDELPERVFARPERPASGRLCPPEPAAGTGGLVLSEEQVQRWREEGYIHISGIWPTDVIDAAASDSTDLAPFPNPDGSQPDSGRPVFGFDPKQKKRPGPSNNLLGTARPGAFPYHENPALSAITLHPRILGAVSQLLGRDVEDIRLTQSMVGGKYGGKELEEEEKAETFERGPDGRSPGFGNARGDQGMCASPLLFSRLHSHALHAAR